MSAHLVEFRDLVKTFPGVRALDGVSFTIGKGEVHALVGENGAGKSTLMNILGGQYLPDSGEVYLRGAKVAIRNPNEARQLGVGVVYQELRLCPNLTVAENIFLGRERDLGKGRIDWPLMRTEAARILDRLGADIHPNTKVGNMTVANQQLVEIARAISLNSEILIMDEPTSALSLKECEQLFRNIKALKENGVTIIYISHRMEEIFGITDRISVLRDGKYFGTFDRDSTNPNEIVKLIAGKELAGELGRSATSAVNRDKTALEARNLSRPDGLNDVSFKLYDREILGIYGLQGAGRTELLETIFGLAPQWSGELYMFEQRISNRTPAEAIANGFAMVTENRRDTGIFPRMTITENINSANVKSIRGRLGVLSNRKMKAVGSESKRLLNIKTSSLNKLISDLSGGNQQKVIIAKWLATNPKILLVDEPTRGIDVGAKAEIFKIIKNLRDDGLSVIIVSSEIGEIISESDRVLVMKNGSLVAELTGDDLTREKILRHAL